MAKSVLADYRSKFIQHMTAGMNNVVQACKVLAEAKQNLDEKEFQKLCGELKLSKRESEKLVRIGTDKRVDMPEVKDRLPYAFTTIDRILSLDNDQFIEAVKNNVIHPSATRDEIDNFKKYGLSGTPHTVVDETRNPNEVRVATIWLDKTNLDDKKAEEIMKLLQVKLAEIEKAVSVQPMKLTPHGLVEKLKPSDKKLEKEAKTLQKNQEKVLRILVKAIKKKARLEAKSSFTSITQVDVDLSEAINCQPDYESVQAAVVRVKFDINLDEFIKNPSLAEEFYNGLIEKEKKGLPL